jgi:hypothetical protein
MDENTGEYESLSLGMNDSWNHVQCPNCEETGGLLPNPDNDLEFGLRECDFCGEIYRVSNTL